MAAASSSPPTSRSISSSERFLVSGTLTRKNTIAAMALSGKKDEIKTGLNLGLTGYDNLTTPAGAAPNLLYGQGWVGVTAANMADYDF